MQTARQPDSQCAPCRDGATVHRRTAGVGLLATAMTGFAAMMAGGHAAADECFAAGLKRVFPLNCAADLNGDFTVGQADLGLLLLAFGTCQVPGPCDADLNGDGEVDNVDLGLLLLAWSGNERCTIFPGGVGCPSELTSTGEFDAGAAVTAALTLLGFNDLAALAAWYIAASEAQRESLAESLLVLFHAFGESESSE